MTAFESSSMSVDVLRVRLVDLKKFKSKDDVFFELQLANDRTSQNSEGRTPQEEKVWHADFHFLLTPNVAPALNLRLFAKGKSKDSVVADGSVSLANLAGRPASPLSCTP
jgi:hypothetical protein